MSQNSSKGGEILPVLKDSNSKKWYAVYTTPRAEKVVAERLVEADVEAFLPLQKTYRVWSDRKKLILKPLLTSYVFVHVTEKQFPKVFMTNGVVRFVSFEGRPASIPREQIDTLRLLINSNEKIEVSNATFAEGDKVEVTMGSLAGLKGELVRIGRTNRVIVRIDRLDQNLILKIPKTFLRKTGEKNRKS
jgi:transcription antitermination factor NusG